MAHRSAPGLRGRGFLVALLSAVLVVLWSAPAHAHTELAGSTPREGETVGLSTDRIVLSFTDALLADGSAVVVRDSAGRDTVVGEPRVAGNLIDVGLDLAAPGLHTVSYRVVGDDGHAVIGELTFSVVADDAVAGTGGVASQLGAAAPAVTAPPSGPGSLLPWGLGAVALGLFVVLLHTASRRRVTAPPTRRG